jgi:hypothetical protein
MGDQTGAVTIDPAEARFFDFDFVLEGNNLGRVSMSLNDLGSLKVYYSQGITENQDDPAKKEWYRFLKEMRFFAMRRLLRFDTRDIAKTNLDKKDFQHLATTQGPKEEDMTTMNESKWNHKSSKKTSRAVQGKTEVIVRHAKPVDEMFAGSRSQRKNIKAIFIQNADGERFKYPFIHTAGAFAMAQHVDHGGVPHDPAGKAIIGMSEEMAKLAEFKNKVRSASLHDDAHHITERAIGRLNELRSQIEALGKGHHYRAWAESFDEQQYMDDGLEMDAVAMEEYKQKFTQTSFQEELTGYFPLLHRIMKETNKVDLEDYVGESGLGKTLGTVAGMALAPEIPFAGAIGGAIGSAIGDSLTDEEIKESAMSEIHAELCDIWKRDDTVAFYDLFSADTPAGRFIQDMANDLVIELGLHPKDDFEKIEQIVWDEMEDLCRNNGVDEVDEAQGRDDIGGAGVAYQAGYQDGKRAKASGINPEVNTASWGEHIGDYRRGMHDAFNLPAKAPESQFEEWAESVEQGELTDDQVDVMRDELDKLPKNPDSNLPELELGPEGSTAWTFFNELGIEDSDLKDMFNKMTDIDDETNAVEVFQKWGQQNYPELLVALGMSAEEEPAPEEPPAPPAEEPQDNPLKEISRVSGIKQEAEMPGMPNSSLPMQQSFIILDPTLIDKISDMNATEVEPDSDGHSATVSSNDPNVTAQLMAFAKKNPQRLKVAGTRAIDPTRHAGPVDNKWGKSQDNPLPENEDGKGIPASMAKESMIKEIAKLVKSRYNADNPEVGPFNGKENIALDVKKEISEKFGDTAGEQAEHLAMSFMEKLTKQYHDKHGPVGDDGLSRLKELINNLKGKVEGIGDQGQGGKDFNKNIMSDEGAFKDADAGTKQPVVVPGQKGALPDVMKKGEVVKSLDKSKSFFGKTFEELSDIRKLSGLDK